MYNQECKLQHFWFTYLTCREVGPSKFTDPSSSSTWTTTAGGTLPGGYKAHLQQSPRISVHVNYNGTTDPLHCVPVWFAAECVDWCLSHSEKNGNILQIQGMFLQAFQLFPVLYPKQQSLLHRQDISAKIIIWNETLYGEYNKAWIESSGYLLQPERRVFQALVSAGSTCHDAPEREGPATNHRKGGRTGLSRTESKSSLKSGGTLYSSSILGASSPN